MQDDVGALYWKDFTFCNTFEGSLEATIGATGCQSVVKLSWIEARRRHKREVDFQCKRFVI